jgi:2-oxo-4-hydroxy-4-carboxy-5-ureidoimidazoline decarboxylase
MTLKEINAMNEEMFVEALGGIFEHSPWVARRAWSRRPFASREALHEAMEKEMELAGHDDQLALVRAHPDLGTRAKISSASTAEQAGAGLDQLTPEEFDRLQQLNGAYKTKFGFPFIFAVKGSTKSDILHSLGQRLDSTPDSEFQLALEHISRIARFRLEAAVTQGD